MADKAVNAGADRYDYIIVGAGSAGCVLAERLSLDPSIRVLLLEFGPPDGGLMMTMPRGVAKLYGPNKPQSFFYEASRGGNHPPEPWAKGRTLGGSSSINGMVYIRGMPADYDGWAAAGCTGWGWDDIGPCFVALEDHVLGAAPDRGVGGPLRISVAETPSPLAGALLAAARERGVPVVDDINDIATQASGSFGYQPQTIFRGKRWSAARAFLDKARRRPNLTILTDARAERILFDGLRATGLSVRHAGTVRTFEAREIILSAGAIESPKLLQLSGIGPAPMLKALGIEPLVDLPAAGADLLEHRYFALQYQVARGSENSAHRGIGLVASAARYFLTKGGPLARSVFELAGFVKTRPGLDRPDAQLGIGLYSLAPKNGQAATTDWAGMSIGGYYARPKSRGSVMIASNDVDAPPRIDANYFAVEEDRIATIALFRWIRAFAASDALARFTPKEMTPAPAAVSDDEILDAVLRFGASGKHVAGTCRMGADDASVVDPGLRVRHVSGLRVCDTSIMPAMISGNTNGPAMAMALRASQLILAADRR